MKSSDPGGMVCKTARGGSKVIITLAHHASISVIPPLLMWVLQD